MKMILSLLAACALSASAQTYFKQWFTNWSDTTCTNSFTVGTNQLATLATVAPSSLSYGLLLRVTYPEGETVMGHKTASPILGPCVVQSEIESIEPNPVVLLWKLETVNTTDAGNLAVQPAGLSATVRLQTSTNLATWQTMTNASFGPTNGNRFFRLSLSIP